MIAKRLAQTGAALTAALLIAGCGSMAPNDPAALADRTTTESGAHQSVPSVQLNDGWAKAGDAGGMTGLFGTITNDGDHGLVITSVKSPAAETVELHEVTPDGVMQEIDGDVVIPAGGSYELTPGANHIMLMGLTQTLLAGDEVRVALHFDDGSSVNLTAPVKDYAGANEEYGAGAGHDGHGSH